MAVGVLAQSSESGAHVKKTLNYKIKYSWIPILQPSREIEKGSSYREVRVIEGEISKKND